MNRWKSTNEASKIFLKNVADRIGKIKEVDFQNLTEDNLADLRLLQEDLIKFNSLKFCAEVADQWEEIEARNKTA